MLQPGECCGDFRCDNRVLLGDRTLFVVGLAYTEIADTLEITLATVKWRIYKGREEVQLALAREGITFGKEAEDTTTAPIAN
jgi:hypothetical protein